MTISLATPQPLVRRPFIVALLLVLVLLAHSIWDYVETRRFKTRVDAIVERGEPISTPGFRRPGSSAGTADADRLYRAAATLAGNFRLSDSTQEAYRVSVAMRDGNWTPEMIGLIRARVGDYSDALAYADRAAPLSFNGFLPGWTFTYLGGGIAALQRLCEMRAVERAFAGDGDAAFASLYSGIRLARANSLPPRLQGLPVVIQRATPSAAARERLVQALSEIDDDHALEHGLIRSRSTFVEEALGVLRGSGRAYESAVVRGAAAFQRPWYTHQTNRGLDRFSALIDASRTPQPDRWNAIMAVGPWPQGYGSLAAGSRSTLEAWLKNETAQIERIHCARRLVAGEVVDCHF
jgi:hypothetical protein